MGRKSHRASLVLWANGTRVGTWEVGGNAGHRLRYAPDWVASSAGRPLSLSLPFGYNNAELRGAAVEYYFENLLPDSTAIRKRVAARYRVSSTDAFDLLQAIGQDCVGSIQLLPEGAEPFGVHRVDGVALSEHDIARHLQHLVSPEKLNIRPEHEDDFRISLAGAQEKTALLRWQGQWLRPTGATPTTHILKLPMGLVGGHQADFSTSVDNEWLCLRILRAYGLPVADAQVETFESRRVLVVERFDRRISQDGQAIWRLPQEDFCQALGISPLLKYEADGGPGLGELAQVLRGSSEPRDLATLLTTQILFWLLRATDGHAKNFSIHLLPGGRYRLTPLYDVMSAYPVMGKGPNKWSARDLRMAMALRGKNKQYEAYSIMRRHFNSTARHIQYGESAEDLIETILAHTPDVLHEVSQGLPDGFNPHVLQTILTGLEESVRRLAAMPAD